MRKRAKLLLAATLAAGLIGGTAAGTAVAGADKFELLGPAGIAFCDGSGVNQGAPGGFGFAVINAPSNGTVHTTVSLKKLQPNSTYAVRLIQGNADCFTIDGTITTNEVGNGNVHISEAATSSTALVAVDNTSGPDFYVTETYFH